MDTSAATLRELKRKYDEERDSNEKMEKLWLDTKLDGFQLCVKLSAEEGETDYSTYVMFRPSEECMNILKERFPGCEVTKSNSDFSDKHYKIEINWKEEAQPQTHSEDALEEFEDELFNTINEEDADEDQPEEQERKEPPKTDEEYRLRLQDEMYTFYELWKNRNPFHSNPPEWVKKFDNNVKGTYIPDRGYDWQEKEKKDEHIQ